MQMDERVEELLGEFNSQRIEIKNMITEIEELRTSVSMLFPETIDARTRKFLEEKMKTMVAFYNVLLDMRKEISKSIKDELDIRRRITEDGLDVEDVDALLDIGELARKVEKFSEMKDAMKNKRIEAHKGISELEEKGIEIPGLKELKELEGEGDE